MTATRLTRRRFVGSGTALAGGLALAGQSRMPAALAQDAPVTLQVYVHLNHPFDNVKPLFEAKYPNIKLDMMGTNDMQVFRATLAANGEGTPDLFWPEASEVQEFGQAGALLDVTDLIEEHKADLAPGKLAECLIAKTGQYVAWPGDIAVIGLYYRDDLLNSAGVTIPEDWTWEEFIETGQKIKQDTGAFSMTISTAGGDATALPWTILAMQLGGSITNADGTEVTLDNEAGIAAMVLLKQIYDAGIHIDDSPFNETYFAALAGGQIAISPLPVWYRGFGMEPAVTTPEQGLGQWRVALLPRASADSPRTANYGGANIASTKYTQHPDEVKQFMVFALGTMEGAAACAEYGIVPPYLPFLESETWLDQRSPLMGDFAYNEVWTECVQQYPTNWHKQPVFEEAMIEIGAQVPPMLNGEVEIEAGMKALGDRVRELNARYQG
jgi:ABC-type glycerol-3-phosphate transport system substrate-binding protein